MTTILILTAVLLAIAALTGLMVQFVRHDGLGHTPLPPRLEDQSPWQAYRG